MKAVFVRVKRKLYKLTIRVSLILFCLIFFSKISAQSIYYFISGALNTASNWNTARDGSGTSMNNFSTTNRTYVVQSGQNVTNTTAFSISGSGTKFQIENNATLTANAGITLAASTIFQIDNGGTYVHNTTANSLFSGTESFGASSTVQINNWMNATTPVTNNITRAVNGGDGNTYYYGNLIINWAIGAATIWDQNWGATVIYLAAGNFTVTSAFNGTYRMTTNNSDINAYVYGNFTWNSSGTYDFTTRNKNSNLYVNGNINLTAGSITASGSNTFCVGLFQTYGTGTVSWSNTGATITYTYFYVNANKTVNLASNFNMGSGLSSPLTIAANGTLDASAYIISYGSVANVNVNGTIRTSNLDGLGGTASSTLSNSPAALSFNPGTGSTVVYYATGSQSVTAYTTYQNVTILGGGTKTLQGNATINANLTLTSGKLDIQNFTLTMASGAGITSANSTNYIVTGNNGARLRQNGLAAAAARLFPVGTGSCYLPITITPATANSSYSINVFTGATTNGTAGGTPWNATQKRGMVDAVWNADRNAGGGSDVLIFQWDNCYSSLEGSYFATASNSNIGIWKWVSGTSWSTAASNFSNNNSNSGGFNTSANNTSPAFNGPYIVALLSDPLANDELNFKVVLLNNDVVVTWSLQNPASIKDFEVERSYDKANFVKIGNVKAGIQNTYSYVDRNLESGVIYYRLVLNTPDGVHSYSPIIAVTKKMTAKIKLYNNPVCDKLFFYHLTSLNAQYRILNMDGQVLMKGNIAANAISTSLNIQLLSKGVYLLQFIKDGEIATERFIKH